MLEEEGGRDLLKYINPKEYLELDITGKPDLLVDLDKAHPLPFVDNRFDVVISTEVLEHLDELHRVFKELLRISSKYFFKNNSDKLGFKILDEFSVSSKITIKGRLLKILITFFLDEKAANDLFYGNYWCLLEVQ